MVRYINTLNVDPMDMGYKEGLNRGLNINKRAMFEKESKSGC